MCGRGAPRRIGRAAACGGLAALACAAAAGPDPRATLDEAWREYRFQSYDKAARLFASADAAGAPEAARREARCGRAMLALFREKDPEPADAVAGFDALLREGLDGERALLVRGLRAEALAASGRIEEANAAWAEVIDGAPSSILAQDALLRRTIANLGPLASEQTAAALRYLEEKRRSFPPPTRERPMLAPALDMLLGDARFWRGEYAEARAALVRYVEIGTKTTTSYPTQASAMMRIARISEEKLGDPATAGRYYRRLVEETPNDVRSFFALERAIAYGALTREEVRGLKLYGVTDRIVDGFFARRGEGTP
jgi:tetratricopeptide (TPR) repeat protein